MSLQMNRSTPRVHHRYGPTPWFYRLVARALNVIVRLFYIWEVQGEDQLPTSTKSAYRDGKGVRHSVYQNSYLLGVKHASALDIYVLGLTIRRPLTWMMKSTLSRWWWQATLFRHLGAVPVIRQQDSQDRRNLIRGLYPDHAIDVMATPVKRGYPGVVYCEGSRGETVVSPRDVDAIKTGVIRLALMTDLPIYPVGLAGTRVEARRDGWHRRRAVMVIGPPLNPAAYPTAGESLIDQVRLDLQIAIQNCTDQAWSVFDAY